MAQGERDLLERAVRVVSQIPNRSTPNIMSTTDAPAGAGSVDTGFRPPSPGFVSWCT